jgi:AraC-like DNA-binding protein
MDGGDVIVFPRGDQHTMRQGAGTPTPITSIFTPGASHEPPQLSYGGGGRTSRFVCGYLNCDQRFSPLVDALPMMLVVRSRDDYSAIEAIDLRGTRPTVVPQGSGTWLGTTLKFTVNEARVPRPGNGAMLGRQTELMFVEIQDIATRVGYDSEAAFNRAFKRATGCPPATWRKSALSATAEGKGTATTAGLAG